MIIDEIDLFKEIAPGVMEEIADICLEEEYNKDTVLFEKGEEAEVLYILEEGTLNLVIKNGGTLIYALKEPGRIFGWSSMVESGLYTASGVCATDLKVVKIKREKLDKIFDRHPEVGLKVLKRLARVISQRLSNAYRDLLSARGQDTTPSYG
jgi:CRP-like cAMP-binding protein